MTTATIARRLSYQLETLWDWDYDYVPTHHELESLYATATKNSGTARPRSTGAGRWARKGTS
jgi:hypothetical protein